jgi:hypothetical protein
LIIHINIEHRGYDVRARELGEDLTVGQVRDVLRINNSLYAMAYPIKSTYIAKNCSSEKKQVLALHLDGGDLPL